MVVPILLKKFLTSLSGGQMGTGPFFIDIGGNGIALTIFTFFLIILFNWFKLIVDMKLIIFCLELNFNFGNIFVPTLGVTAKKTQLH